MDTMQILLDIHGEMKGISRDVAHVRGQYDTLDARVISLHGRIDEQEEEIKCCQRLIYKGVGMATGIGIFLGAIGHWCKTKIFGG